MGIRCYKLDKKAIAISMPESFYRCGRASVLEYFQELQYQRVNCHAASQNALIFASGLPRVQARRSGKKIYLFA